MPIYDDRFESSGGMNIEQSLLHSINVNHPIQAGCIFIFWIAD